MKAHLRALDGRLTFELEGATAKDLFSELASVQEVFDAERTCGLCGSKDIRFVVRESEGKRNGKQQTFSYYELRCVALLANGDPCRARFDFGQSLDTENLFPKRKDADGNWLPSRGWYRYQPNQPKDGTEPERGHQPPPPQQPKASETQPFSQQTNSGGFQGDVTPEGMQPSFDRLGVIFNRPAPTRWPTALDLIREMFEHAGGKTALQDFDRIYRDWQRMNKPPLQAVNCKGLLAQLMNTYDSMARPV